MSQAGELDPRIGGKLSNLAPDEVIAALATSGVLSHRSGGALWCVRPWSGRIDITTPWRKSKRHGILLHRAVLAPDEITINEAERLHLEGPHELAGRHPTKPGIRALRALAPPTHTRAVIRITWRDLDEPGRLAAELAAFF